MSSWMRIGGGHPWHRVTPFERRDGLARGEFRLTCGGVIPTAGGWEERMPELVGPEDQHPSCRTRAVREDFWQSQWTGGLLPDVVRDLAHRAAPWLADVRVDGPDEVPGVGNVFRLQASNLDGAVAGGGPRWSDASADLLATLEALPH